MDDFQKRVADFVESRGLKHPAEAHALDLVSEIGEVAKEILKSTDYGKHPPVAREEAKGELGDALFSLTALANALGVDLGEALDMVLKKYDERLKKGGAGSENE